MPAQTNFDEYDLLGTLYGVLLRLVHIYGLAYDSYGLFAAEGVPMVCSALVEGGV